MSRFLALLVAIPLCAEVVKIRPYGVFEFGGSPAFPIARRVAFRSTVCLLAQIGNGAEPSAGLARFSLYYAKAGCSDVTSASIGLLRQVRLQFLGEIFARVRPQLPLGDV
jgi:hypothetical protein